MASHVARIERSNHRNLEGVPVEITTREVSAGREAWGGEFISRSADGIRPDERLSLTLDNGQQGTAKVSETRFDSRRPGETLVRLTGMGPLA
jgi:hypothetical protein